MEALDSRQYLSVTAYMSGSQLVVNGDHAANTIVVDMKAASGKTPQSAVVMASGKMWTFGGGKIHVNNVKVNAGAGNDYVEVRGSAFTHGQGADVRGGEGDDTINFTNLYTKGGYSFGDDENGRGKLYASPSGSQLEGGEDADKIYGGKAGDLLIGDGGDDYITGNGGDDDLYGGYGHDYLHGGEGRDLLDGGAGNDQLNGGHGDDKLYGGAGHDTLYGEGGWDLLDGGSGTNKLFQ